MDAGRAAMPTGEEISVMTGIGGAALIEPTPFGEIGFAASAGVVGLRGLGRAADVIYDAAREVKVTAEQVKNIGRFEKKLPANAKESLSVKPLPNEGVAVQATSPGRVPGSSAVYEKQIDAAGNTIQYTKTTYDPAGNIVHVKDKLNGGVFP